MSLFKAFFKIIKKNLFGVLLHFGITIGVLMLLNGIYSDNESKKATLDSYKIYVENEDDSEYARALEKYLGSIHKIREDKLNQDQIKDLLYYEEIVSYIRIPKGFGEEFAKTGGSRIENMYDEAMPVGLSISLQIDNYLNTLRGYTQQGVSVEEAAAKTKESLDITKYVSISNEKRDNGGRMKGCFIYLPYGIMTILIMGMFPAVLSFNKGEKRNRIQVSSMSQSRRNGWIFVAGAAFALIIFAVLVVTASLCGGDPSQIFSEKWWLSVANAGVYTLVTAMMITMFANIPFFANSQPAALSNIVGLGFCFLGGTFVPLSILGDGVKKVGCFLPNYWYSTAVNRIYDGGTFADIWDCYALQLAFGLVCLFVGLAVARITAERKEIA